MRAKVEPAARKKRREVGGQNDRVTKHALNAHQEQSDETSGRCPGGAGTEGHSGMGLSERKGMESGAAEGMEGAEGGAEETAKEAHPGAEGGSRAIIPMG